MIRNKKPILLLFVFLISYRSSFAEDSGDSAQFRHKLILKTDLSQIALKIINPNTVLLPSLSLEHQLNNTKNSLVMSFYDFRSNSLNPKNKISTLFFIPEYRSSLQSVNCDKIYVGCYLKYIKRKETFIYSASIISNGLNAEAQSTEKLIGTGLNIGYQINVFKRFVTDFLVGFGYRYRVYDELNVNRKVEDGSHYFGKKGNSDLRIALNIGFRLF